jgi:hypothetical protein
LKDESVINRINGLLQYFTKAYINSDDIESAPVVWHYTNMAALFGIIENSSIWLSDHRRLNDKNEIVYAKELIEKAYYRNMGLGGVLLRPSDEHMRKMHESESFDKPVYICSFSVHKNLLSQWKGYANNLGGIAIGFDTRNLVSLAARQNIMMARIKYGDAEALPLIDEFTRLYWRTRRSIPEGDSEGLNACDFAYNTISLQFEAAIKNAEWSEEGEFRLISRAEINPEEFRIQNGVIHTFTRVKINCQQCIKEIVLLDSDPVSNSVVRKFLKTKNLDSVKTDVSSLAMRFQ